MKLKKMMNGFLQDFLTKNNIEFEDWSISVNNQDGFGDYSSNIALKLSKDLGRNPREIAEKIKEAIQDSELIELSSTIFTSKS